MPAPLLAAKAATSATDSQGNFDPKGAFMGNNRELIILIMVGSAILIYIQHARNGTPQDGTQFVAIGVVGFVLLFIAAFAPAIAFAFALLFGVAVALNSPNGVPIISQPKASSKNAS